MPGRSAARPRGAPDVAALLGDARLFVADPREGGDALADLLLRRRAEAQPQARLGGLAVTGPFRPGIERNAGIERGPHQLSHIDLVGQFHPTENAAFGDPRLDGCAELALQRL